MVGFIVAIEVSWRFGWSRRSYAGHGYREDGFEDSVSKRLYVSDDELNLPPEGDVPGYGTVDNLALAQYQSEKRARREAEESAEVERIREQTRQAREHDSENGEHPPR